MADRKSNRLGGRISSSPGPGQWSIKSQIQPHRAVVRGTGVAKGANREVLAGGFTVERARVSCDRPQPGQQPSAGRYQVTRWSNSYAGSGGARGSPGIAESSSQGEALPASSSHSGGPRAWAIRGGVAGSPRCSRIARTTTDSVGASAAVSTAGFDSGVGATACGARAVTAGRSGELGASTP